MKNMTSPSHLKRLPRESRRLIHLIQEAEVDTVELRLTENPEMDGLDCYVPIRALVKAARAVRMFSTDNQRKVGRDANTNISPADLGRPPPSPPTSSSPLGMDFCFHVGNTSGRPVLELLAQRDDRFAAIPLAATGAARVGVSFGVYRRFFDAFDHPTMKDVFVHLSGGAKGHLVTEIEVGTMPWLSGNIEPFERWLDVRKKVASVGNLRLRPADLQFCFDAAMTGKKVLHLDGTHLTVNNGPSLASARVGNPGGLKLDILVEDARAVARFLKGAVKEDEVEVLMGDSTIWFAGSNGAVVSVLRAAPPHDGFRVPKLDPDATWWTFPKKEIVDSIGCVRSGAAHDDRKIQFQFSAEGLEVGAKNCVRDTLVTASVSMIGIGGTNSPNPSFFIYLDAPTVLSAMKAWPEDSVRLIQYANTKGKAIYLRSPSGDERHLIVLAGKVEVAAEDPDEDPDEDPE